MPKKAQELTFHKVRALAEERKPGFHAVSPQLYLKISPTGGKSWVYRYQDANRRRRDLGLGPYPKVSLAAARARVKAIWDAGTDPLLEKEKQRQQAALELADTTTFRAAGEMYFKAHKMGWGAPAAHQFTAMMTAYAYPVIGDLPVKAINLGLVLKVIEESWSTKPRTMNRVRARIEAILDMAIAREYRDGPNPARWKGHIDKMLPSPEKIAVKNFAAIDHRDMPSFMAALRATDGIPDRALEFAILTATRTDETREATWAEINLEERVWTIPAARMKGKPNKRKEHRVPLCGRALEILDEMKAKRTGAAIFPARTRTGFMGDHALLHALRLINPTATTHGFRASFKTWATESTEFSSEIIEWCLAHITGPKAEQAYRRGEALQRRSRVMDAWAAFLDGQAIATADVVPLRA